MKMRAFSRIAIALLIVVMLGYSAVAAPVDRFYVYFEGDCNVRSGPGLDCDDIGVYKRGDSADFCEECAVDDRDVRWYLVETEEGRGWVSSRYAQITDGEWKPIFYYAEHEFSDYIQATETTELLESPKRGVKMLDILEPGDHAVNLGYFYFDELGDRWTYATFDGETGWLNNVATVDVFE